MDLEALFNEVKEKVGAVIAKPKMADKLLGKPPFRFLHDTITAIITTTGFAENLYSAEELDSAAITERQAKMDYLDKIFTTVGICKGSALDIRAAKVVAGLEPENTNLFLLALVECATDSSYDSIAAVQRCLKGEKAGDGPPAKAVTKAASMRTSEAKPSRREDDGDEKRAVAIESKQESKGADDHVDISRDAQPLDRGRSRGGTRGGKPGMASVDSAGLGSLNTDAFPNLDKEIEGCDGTEATTQTLLGAIISKPKLTEKLLSKPPFRFLHDIISEVTRTTGFSRGLYTEEELDSANVQEKSQKMMYLEKMIKLIGVHLNTVVEARPAKIVAGLEAQNTNVLLQLLAVAAGNRPDSSRSVPLALEQLSMPSAANSEGPVAAKVPEKAAVGAVSRTVEAAETKVEERYGRGRQPAPEALRDDILSVAEEKVSGHPSSSRAAQEAEDTSNVHAQAKNVSENEASSESEPRQRSMRPTTALRRPPKVVQGAKDVGMQVVAKKTEGLIIDGQNDDEEEILEVEDNIRLGDDMKSDAKSEGVDSKLVKDIKSRQAEQDAERARLNEIKSLDSEEAKGASSGIRIGRLRKPGADKKPLGSSTGSGDIEKLRSAIQVLVQQTGPLGSTMDFIQEDVGVMTAELRKWEEESVKYEAKLEEEKQKTQIILKPLNTELMEITEQVNEQLERVSSLKASIARKEEIVLQNLKQIVSS